jgi:hypothetical protein
MAATLEYVFYHLIQSIVFYGIVFLLISGCLWTRPKILIFLKVVFSMLIVEGLAMSIEYPLEPTKQIMFSSIASYIALKLNSS